MNFLLSAVTIDFFYSVLHFDKAGDMQKPETANLMYKVSQIDHFHLQLFSAVQSHCIIYRKGNRYRVTLESGIEVGPTLINLAFFSRPYSLIRDYIKVI